MRHRRRSYSRYLGPRLSSELAEATAPYGQEMVIDAFKPMSKAAQNRWQRAQRKPGRPRRGKGVRIISVSVEQDLLQRSDKLANELHISRARMIERGLRVVLAANGK